MLVGRGNWKSQSKAAFGLVLFMPSLETGILSRKKMRKAGNKTRGKCFFFFFLSIFSKDKNC